MLRILRTVPFYAPAYGYGGPVIHTLNISKIQALMGYDVRVFSSNILTNDIISKELPKFEIVNGVKLHRFPIKYRLGQSQYFITPTLPFGFFKYNYDIIHSHSFRTFHTDVATYMAKIRKKPFVFTAHGTLRNISLFNWFTHKKKEAKKIKIFDIINKKFFLNTVDRIIVHSKYEKFWTLKNDVPEKKIAVIPHGVNIENFSNMDYKEKFQRNYKPNGKMILYVGRLLRDYRNLKDLIKVMTELLKELKEIKLWLIGHSFDIEYENELKKLVKDLNLTKQVKFILKPTREDILGAYQYANVVVFPITNSDSFGIPLLEAGAAKTPIISTNRGPATELVKNGKTGILTAEDDQNQLKEALLKILTDKELEEKMGLNGYENVLKNYTWEVVTKKTNDIYNELI